MTQRLDAIAGSCLIGSKDNGRYVLYSDYANIKAENDSLLKAVKIAYRKHHLSDPSIGWEELSDILLNALCNSMGDKKFNEWLREVNK